MSLNLQSSQAMIRGSLKMCKQLQTTAIFSRNPINYQSVEYEEMLLVVREMAMEFDELRNKTLEADEYGMLAFD